MQADETPASDLRELLRRYVTSGEFHINFIADGLKEKINAVDADKRCGIFSAVRNKEWTALHFASKIGDDKVVKIILSSLPSEDREKLIRLEDSEGCSAAFIAAKNGHTGILELLIEALSDEQLSAICAYRDASTGKTILHMAIDRGFATVLDSILQCVPQKILVVLLNAKDTNGNTVIHSAAKQHSSMTIKTIKKWVKDSKEKLNLFSAVDNCENTALHLEAKTGQFEAGKEILKGLSPSQSREVVSKMDAEGNTAVHLAADNGNCAAMKVLLNNLTPMERVVLLTMVDNRNKYTPLHYAAAKGFTDIVRCILDSLTEGQQTLLLDVKSLESKTAEECARLKGHQETVKCLRKYRPKSDKSNLGKRSVIILIKIYN